MKDLEDTAVYIEIDPSDVNYINRIIEGYEYLGILTTLDPKRATCRINSTADTRDMVIDILTHLDAKVTILPATQSALPQEYKRQQKCQIPQTEPGFSNGEGGRSVKVPRCALKSKGSYIETVQPRRSAN